MIIKSNKENQITNRFGVTINTLTPGKIKTIRHQLQLSQTKFAAMLDVSVKTLQDWEQARRKPSRSAKSLLLLAEKHPEIFKKLSKNNRTTNSLF